MTWIDIVILVGTFVFNMVTIVVTLAISWGKFDKRLSLTHQRIDFMETNHLRHMEDDMAQLRKDYSVMRESQIRMEEVFKRLLPQPNVTPPQ